jgi:hypothetical protein
MSLVSVPTFTATIYVGSYDKRNHKFADDSSIIDCCMEYVNDVGLCVSISKTHFIYTDGMEAGHAIGLINYPRFPSEPEDIKQKALALAKILKKKAGQERVSVVFSDETIMLDGYD